ncbi:helical backbone metal receptor [Hymenobacter cheonanensis]|uniref:helical backbone metal receptor n=1 Tax=Hymenobacter sp. CA2-7 TaxID=3063993 RepID=UPI002713AA93|nr:helical backbone metal receptor [Hymenobacter sp. CA2-7]MDO7886407.1 helical backbone metal receptor [Hymenobacter sp. CA2-7]
MAYNSHQRQVKTIDQMGREVHFPYPPLRIVSLVPSQTELLFDLGLQKQLEGVTKFCTHPHNARHKASVIGGTKNFDFIKIRAARPDLIIGNKEENYQDGITELAKHYPVWMSNVTDLPEALEMIRGVGEITGKLHLAESLAAAIKAKFDAIQARPALVPVAYFIWRKPYMVAAAGTFINDMLQRAGFSNVFAHLGRYPEVIPEQLAKAAPARIFLSSEPYPFGEKHVAEFQEICPAAKIQLIDGELFSWYGTRLLFSASYFQTLQHVQG